MHDVAHRAAEERDLAIEAHGVIDACWMRGTFDANEATTMRPLAREKIAVKASPTMRSESVWPGRSALVESESMQSTPSSPTRAMRAKSAGLPSIGV